MSKTGQLIIFIFILLTGLNSMAQLSLQRSIIASVGANESGSANLTTTWTVGEAITGSHTNGAINMAHGFQQPDESSLSIRNFDPNLDLSIYPNPTRGNIIIELEATKAMTLRYTLFDFNGREISLPNSTQHVNGYTQKRFDLTHLANATYLLVISNQSGSQLTSVHIIKN